MQKNWLGNQIIKLKMADPIQTENSKLQSVYDNDMQQRASVRNYWSVPLSLLTNNDNHYDR